jgi:hypothetical protein
MIPINPPPPYSDLIREGGLVHLIRFSYQFYSVVYTHSIIGTKLSGFTFFIGCTVFNQVTNCEL